QEVYDAVAAGVGYDEPADYGDERPGDVRHSCVDPSKAKDVLGWQAAVEFREGVRRTVEYQREHEVG
ncbi:MAG: UDP-glucose 4-epimerase, partial [Armatimonadia bacterium]|nr:UDP-glucose 4-epimerase [Armatimonadia bacterium]